MKKETVFILGLVGLIAIMRFLPHPWNITPIGALALFSGAYISRYTALLVPISALILGDLLGGLYTPVVMICVYLGFIASTLIGKILLFEKLSLNRFGFAIVSSAFLFYLLSNFGMWLEAYPHSVEGMMLCYLNGLPYLAKSLLGDTVYALIFFGTFELIKWQFSQDQDTVDAR